MSVLSGADRIPPFNLEAERSVLGACLLDKDALSGVIETLTVDDFYDPRHRNAFEIIRDMASKDIPVDSLTFRDELVKRDMEERVGGLPFIAAILDAVPTLANVEWHTNIVRDRAIHRRLITVGGEISQLGFDDEKDSDEVIESAEQKVFEVTQSGGRRNQIPIVGEVLPNAIKEIEERLLHGTTMTGVPTGFSDFDNLAGGLQPGSLYILAARPSMGKTAWAINVAQHAALEENIPVLVFSLEMSAKQIALRMLSAESRVNLREIFTSKIVQNDQWEGLREAGKRISAGTPVCVDDTPSMTTLDMRSRCRNFFRSSKLGGSAQRGLIILDYIQLMNSARKVENRQQEVSDISRALKGIAREFNVPVLALSQLSRDVEKRGGNKRPQLSDLRDSGAIEQDADCVMFLYREAYYQMEQNSSDASAELILAKNRNGPTGMVNLVFFREYAKFEDGMGSTL